MAISISDRLANITPPNMIECYECVSIGENVFVLNPNLLFLKPMISLFGKLQDKAVSTAENTIRTTGIKDLDKKSKENIS